MEAPNSAAAPAGVAPAQVNWANGLCSCFDAPMLCLNAAFCSPCVMAQTRGKLGNYIWFKRLKIFLGFLILLYVAEVILVVIYNILFQAIYGEFMQNWDGDANPNSPALAKYVVEVTVLGNTMGPPMGIIAIIYLGFLMKTRMDVRVKMNMPADTCNDCLASVCCSVCTLVQTAREVHVSGKCMNMEEPEGALAGLDKV